MLGTENTNGLNMSNVTDLFGYIAFVFPIHLRTSILFLSDMLILLPLSSVHIHVMIAVSVVGRFKNNSSTPLKYKYF